MFYVLRKEKVELLLLLLFVEALEIQNISLIENIKSPYAAVGTIEVKFEDRWSNVCYYGNQKIWWKREATTACRQLQYEGGWPLEVNQTSSVAGAKYLYNFDCDECKFEYTLRLLIRFNYGNFMIFWQSVYRNYDTEDPYIYPVQETSEC